MLCPCQDARLETPEAGFAQSNPQLDSNFVRDKTTVQQAVAYVSDGGHSRLARHRNRSRCGRYGRFRSCGGVSSAWFPERLTAQSEPCRPVIASCRGADSGLSVERSGVGGASWTAPSTAIAAEWLAGPANDKALYPPAPAVLILLAADQD